MVWLGLAGCQKLAREAEAVGGFPSHHQRQKIRASETGFRACFHFLCHICVTEEKRMKLGEREDTIH